MPVRKPSDWMVYADDRILEYLEENGPASAKDISSDDQIRYGHQHISNRLNLLKQADLVELISNGVFQITNDGMDYLEGKLNLRNKNHPNDTGNADKARS